MLRRTGRRTLSRWTFISTITILPWMISCGNHHSTENINTSELSIVGGKRVTNTNDPVMRSTVAIGDSFGSVFCSGTLISKRKIVTAAHCIDGYRGDMYVLYGSDANTQRNQSRKLAVKKIKEHPRFREKYLSSLDPKKAPNDIGYVELEEDAPEFLRPVSILPATSSIGSSVLLAGYGLTGNQDRTAGILRKVTVKVERVNSRVNELVLGSKPPKGACNGDSGGPAYTIKNGRYYVVGATSRGYYNCRHEEVYTDVRQYSKWLLR